MKLLNFANLFNHITELQPAYYWKNPTELQMNFWMKVIRHYVMLQYVTDLIEIFLDLGSGSINSSSKFDIMISKFWTDKTWLSQKFSEINQQMLKTGSNVLLCGFIKFQPT